MRFQKTLTVLCLTLCVAACSTSSPPTDRPSPELEAATQKVKQLLDHPAPEAKLLQCQDHSDPQLINGVWECPPPPEVLAALQQPDSLKVIAALIAALRKETDFRFQLLLWDWPNGVGSFAPAPSSPPP